MDTLKELNLEKTMILSVISSAASKGDTELVLKESEKLEKIENLISRHSQIVLELETMKSGQGEMLKQAKQVSTKMMAIDETRSKQMLSSRTLGNIIRNDFLRKREDEGIHLQLVKNKTIFCTQSGKRVGLAVATERQPNRWFLGLPVGGFDHAVLLCQRENGQVVDIPLPEKFFEKYGGAMSVSKGQIKFNVVNRGNGLLLQVPGTDGVNGKLFASDYRFLK